VLDALPTTGRISQYAHPGCRVEPSQHPQAASTSALCTANITLDLIPPNTVFEDRLQQVDLRFSRMFRMGNIKVRGNVDIYNLLNASAVLNVTTRYGSQWLQPIQIMGGRLFKFSSQLDF